MKHAERLRNITNAEAYSENSKRLQALFTLIIESAEKRAKDGHSDLLYFFENMNINERQKSVIIAMLQKEGFIYERKESQDKGHYADKPIDILSW